jgi:hypothetical protein
MPCGDVEMMLLMIIALRTWMNSNENTQKKEKKSTTTA